MTSEEGVDHKFVAVEVGQVVRKFRSKRRAPSWEAFVHHPADAPSTARNI